jgi:hypothetical protein
MGEWAIPKAPAQGSENGYHAPRGAITVVAEVGVAGRRA